MICAKITVRAWSSKNKPKVNPIVSIPPGCLGNEGLSFNGSIGHRNTDHFEMVRPEEGGGSFTASQRKVPERREVPPEGGGQHRR